MSTEGILRFLKFKRISILELPEDGSEELLSELKKSSSVVIDYKIKNIKELFQLLANYREQDKRLLFINNDQIIKESVNSKYTNLLYLLSENNFSPTTLLEEENVTWDLNYDKFKIEGFNQYNGNIIFITELPPQKIESILKARHCFYDKKILKEFGEI